MKIKFISRAKRKALQDRLAEIDSASAEAKEIRGKLGWGEPAPKEAPAPKKAPSPKKAAAPKKAPVKEVAPVAPKKTAAPAKKASAPKKKEK